MTAPTRSAAQLAEDATALLRSVGQRVTRPRVAVLARVIAAGDAHLSADMLFDDVTAHDAGVHRATVYRTLEGLADAGVLSHVHLDRGVRAYHLAEGARPAHVHPHPDEHLHGQCSRCGRVVDLPPGVLGDAADRIRQATGFELHASHAALSGRCEECAATGR